MSTPQCSQADTVATLKNMMVASTTAMRGMTAAMEQALYLIGAPHHLQAEPVESQPSQPDDAAASDAVGIRHAVQEVDAAKVQDPAAQEAAAQAQLPAVQEVAVEEVQQAAGSKRPVPIKEKAVRRKRMKRADPEVNVGDLDADNNSYPMVITKNFIIESIGTPVLDRPGFRARYGDRLYIYNAGYRVKRWVKDGVQLTLEIVDTGEARPQFRVTVPFLRNAVVHKTPTEAYQAFTAMFGNKVNRRRSGQDMFGLKDLTVRRLLEASVRHAEQASGVAIGAAGGVAGGAAGCPGGAAGAVGDDM